MTAADENKYFSVVAMFIMFRETLEAAVIVSILLQCMKRIQPKLVRQVWWGSAVGIIVSLCVGAIFVVIYYVASAQIFKGDAKFVFKAVMSWIAVIFITWLAFAMLRFYGLEEKYQRKLKEAVQTAGKDAIEKEQRAARWSVWLLSFTAVFREGVETVVFLGGITAGTSISAIPLAAFVGLLLGLSVGAFVYYTGRQMKDLMWFFVLSSLFLLFIAAGLLAWGASDFQHIGYFGRWSVWYQDRDWWNVPMWDIGECCSDSPANENKFFPLLRAIIGYQDRPTVLEGMLYLIFWAGVIAFGVWKYRSGSLFDADFKYHMQQKKLAAEGKLLPDDTNVVVITGQDKQGFSADGSSSVATHQSNVEEPKTAKERIKAKVVAATLQARQTLHNMYDACKKLFRPLYRPVKNWISSIRRKLLPARASTEANRHGDSHSSQSSSAVAPANLTAWSAQGQGPRSDDVEAAPPMNHNAFASNSNSSEIVPSDNGALVIQARSSFHTIRTGSSHSHASSRNVMSSSNLAPPSNDAAVPSNKAAAK